MADLSDVEQAIVTLVSSLVYPNGITSPSAVLNKGGAAVAAKVYRGWPQPAPLDADLAAGNVNISVFSRGSVERNTTRYSADYQEISRNTATVTAAVVDNVVTIGGVVNTAIPQFVTVLVGPRLAVSYAIQSGDTLATIAVAIAALLTANGMAVSVNGSVLTVSTSAFMVAKVGVTGAQMSEVRRQETQVLITAWCPDATTRDNVAKLIEPTLAVQTFLTMPDTSAARFRYHGTVVSDGGQKEQLYRRDLVYDVEYATTITDTATEITSVTLTAEGGPVSIGVTPGNPTTESVLPTA